MDSTDLKLAVVAVRYYLRAHDLIHKPAPPAALRLLDHLTSAMSASGPEDVVPQPHWITTAELAARLGCSQRHARRLAARIGTRVGNRWLIPEEDTWTTR